MSGFGYDVLGFGSGAGVAPTEVDDEFNRVSFLSHFEGANNGVNNVFDDGSASNHTITANYNVTQGSFGPFARPEGYWGVHFNPESEGLSVVYGTTTHSYWNSNFTWEFWINSADIKTCAIISSWALAGFQYSSYAIHMQSNGKMALYNANLPGQGNLNGATAINDGAWHHIAITQVDDGGSTKYYRIFVDGVLDAYSTASAWTQGASDSVITFGCESPEAGTSYKADRRLAGVMSNMRLNTTIVYSTSSTTIGATIFTPPSSPLSAITGTAILTLQSNRFVDKSSNAYGITNTGAPAVSAFGPFLTDAAYDPAANGASAYFKGTGDYISAANSAEFYMDDAAYTIEFWFFDSPPSSQYVFDNYAGGTAGGMNLYLTTAGKIGFRFSSTTDSYKDHDTGDGAFIKGSWNHIAIVRTYASSNTTLVTYANGVAKKTTTFNDITAKINTSEILTIGDAFQGYITDFRLVKGTAVYTGNFTPPTAPLTAITNTKLLLNMADGQAIDSAAQNNLTLYGTAKLSTGQAKFGDTSILFDGNSDFATFPHSESNDISGGNNWTVEFYWRFVDNDATQYQEIATKGAGFQLYAINGALAIALSASNNSSYFLTNTGGTTLSDNTWYHIAVVKNGTGYKVYLDGTSESNLDGTSSSNVNTGTSPWCLGAYTSSSYYANGYMDEFRLSKFARYTGNFTAPSAPFPSQGQV